ncbi:MAG: hypothetical protein JXR76_14595 [Deltaproteobacteria bacterium]|nr:hypothetical protein [Deltaproteobacteria bacterium]
MAIRYVWVSVLVILLLPQCAKNKKTSAVPAAGVVQIDQKFKDLNPKTDLSNIAFFTPANEATFLLWKSLSGELAEEFNIRTLVTTQRTSAKDMGNLIRATTPVAVILVDNSTVKKYREYQKYHKSDNTPAFIFMASFLKEIIGLVRNANGIAYEVPGVLSMVRARNVLNTEVAKIGVVHRKAFSDYVKSESSMMKVEKFKMVTAAVSDSPTIYELEAALDDLFNRKKVDALWILNDNALLKQELVADVWLPTLQNSPMPTIVNVPVLLNPEIEFGTLAVIPDSAALGVQAANMIFNAYDKEWELEENKVEMPLSVLTYIDRNLAQKNFGLRENAANFIDKQL